MMLTSLKWINEFVDISDIETNAFSDAMTMSGSKVEKCEVLGEEISGVVVGLIREIEKHPKADKLVVCKVDVGTEEIQIVTGADNVKAGDRIPVAVVGATLKGGLKIRRSKLREVESNGMLCSAEELGLNTNLLSKEDTRGIYILKEEYDLGTNIKPILGLDDTVVEFELTSNRADCQSILGMSREAAATFEKLLVQPVVEIDDNAGEENINDYLCIEVENTKDCPRYAARMMKVNKIEPSPQWMQNRLVNCGIRPISNIVDVTNYVMLELGQPLHAFDYSKLGSKKILVRNAKKAETIITLDGNERKLSQDALVITNGETAMAIAGIMGGGNSEISDDTEIIVIESANFNKNSIRNTSKKLNFRTDASTKFEKGLDPELSGLAADRAAQLLMDIGACRLISGKLDIYSPAEVKGKITVDTNWVNTFIGIDISKEVMADYLERLSMEVEISGDILEITVPSFRQDLTIKEDIAEEIARIYGYNNIPNTIIKGEATEGGRSEFQLFENRIRSLLVEKGFYEILTYSFTSKNKLIDLNISEDDDLITKSIGIINPLGEENSLMRTTLLPGLLQVVSHNYNRNIGKGSFFEIAVNYEREEELDRLPTETKMISMGMYGETDFFELKGYIQLIMEKARIKKQGIAYHRSDSPIFHPNRNAVITIEGKEIGIFGEIHPKVCKNYDLPARTYVASLDLEAIYSFAASEIQFRELPKYPGVMRDLAFVAQESLPAKAIEDVIEKNAGELLEEILLFDVYKGTQIEAGFKSLAYSIYFRAKDRTLTDGEIKEIMDKIVKQCQIELNVRLREQ